MATWNTQVRVSLGDLSVSTPTTAQPTRPDGTDLCSTVERLGLLRLASVRDKRPLPPPRLRDAMKTTPAPAPKHAAPETHGVDSVVLARLLNEVRNNVASAPTAYNRMHHPHNR